MAVYSSTGTLAYKYQGGNTEYYLMKHMMILIFGFGIMYGVHLINYTYFLRIAKVALMITIPLLFLTLLMGTSLNEASRWLKVPVLGISFQTSDLAKLALLLYVARTLSRNQNNIKDFKSAFVPLMAPVLLVCALILPANFSTASILFCTCLVLMFIGRINLKYVFATLGIALSMFVLFILVAKLTGYDGRISTWEKRIESFSSKDPDANYQSERAKIAIATAGITGKGPGNSVQRNFLPHPYSDFIFAIIIEEFGLVGAFMLLLLYLTLLYRTLLIVKRSDKAFASLFAFGCAFSLVFQALINMAVAVNLFPVTGQPLPFISMGGTSLWFTCCAVGIIISVSRDLEKEEQANVKGNLQTVS